MPTGNQALQPYPLNSSLWDAGTTDAARCDNVAGLFTVTSAMSLLLDTRSFSPFKGYCVCEKCRDSSAQWQRLFPHPVLLHESPDMINKVDSVCSEYLTGPRYVGCCAIATCGGPLTNDNTDEVFATDFDPRSSDPLRVLGVRSNNILILQDCKLI